MRRVRVCDYLCSKVYSASRALSSPLGVSRKANRSRDRLGGCEGVIFKELVVFRVCGGYYSCGACEQRGRDRVGFGAERTSTVLHWRRETEEPSRRGEPRKQKCLHYREVPYAHMHRAAGAVWRPTRRRARRVNRALEASTSELPAPPICLPPALPSSSDLLRGSHSTLGSCHGLMAPRHYSSTPRHALCLQLRLLYSTSFFPTELCNCTVVY